MTTTTQESLIGVLNVCDNFRPHLSSETLVPFLLAPNTRPALGLLRPPVVAALRADNAWRSAHGHLLAWDIPNPVASADDADAPLPYIAFAAPLAAGPPAARTEALAETLERWRAEANGEGEGKAGGGSGGSPFKDVIGGSRWRAEWYDVYRAPGGALRADGRDPRTVLDVGVDVGPRGGGYGYLFSMERSAC